LARAFGGGMGLGLTCGAVTGAFMILGFKIQDEQDEKEARYKAYHLAREFARRFGAIHGTIQCRDLLGGVDLTTETGRRLAQEQKLFTTLCPGFVRDAATILDDMI